LSSILYFDKIAPYQSNEITMNLLQAIVMDFDVRLALHNPVINMNGESYEATITKLNSSYSSHNPDYECKLKNGEIFKFSMMDVEPLGVSREMFAIQEYFSEKAPKILVLPDFSHNDDKDYDDED
jgi:hypothetical protein